LKAPSSSKSILRWTCLATALSVPTGTTTEVPGTGPDQRIARVEAFFQAYSCPAPTHAAEYVRAADLYGIDYRILPAISLLESTCGSFQRGNNHWGWDSLRTAFPSVEHGIDFVTRQLAQANPYRDRDLDGKLFSYNPRLAYVGAVKRLIQQIEAY